MGLLFGIGLTVTGVASALTSSLSEATTAAGLFGNHAGFRWGVLLAVLPTLGLVAIVHDPLSLLVWSQVVLALQLPFTLGIIIGAGASHALIRRIGIRIVVFTGITMGTAGLLYFARLPAHGSYVPDLLPTIAIVSVGMGMTFVPLTLLATTNVESSDAGLASGLFNTSQQVGGALGLAILSTLAASRTSNLLGHGVPSSVVVRDTALTSGYHLAFAVGAAMLLAALVVLAVTIRKQDVESIDHGEVGLTPA